LHEFATCYACGQSGHYKANCPTQSPPPTPPEAASASTGLPASHIEVELLRQQANEYPPEVTAERAERYASQVRAAMGWGREARETKLRALANEQLEESRRHRLV